MERNGRRRHADHSDLAFRLVDVRRLAEVGDRGSRARSRYRYVGAGQLHGQRFSEGKNTGFGGVVDGHTRTR